MIAAVRRAAPTDQRVPLQCRAVTRGTPYLLGRLAGKQFRKAQWVWQSVTGSEEDAIRAEQGVGRDMAAAVREQARGSARRRSSRCSRRSRPRSRTAFATRSTDSRSVRWTGDHPTAFALPGGFIFVAPALVDLAGRDRDELAFVIAHEMAHVIRRHAIDRLLGQKVITAATLATPATRTLAPWVRQVGLQWLERAYSREQEFEADELGGRLMRAAGFDPLGAVRVLEKLGAIDAGADPAGLGTYLSTHPPIDARIGELRERLTLGRRAEGSG